MPHYINQHKHSIKTYNSFDGEGVKIIEMKNIEVVWETEKYWTVSYVDKKGKKKEEKISKVFDMDLRNL